MSHALTAEDLFAEMKTMPATEWSRFFALLGEVLFPDDDSSHEQLFGHLVDAEFTAVEAAEYLEVSIPTFRRYVQGGNLNPSHRVGRSQMFATRDLGPSSGHAGREAGVVKNEGWAGFLYPGGTHSAQFSSSLRPCRFVQYG